VATVEGNEMKTMNRALFCAMCLLVIYGRIGHAYEVIIDNITENSHFTFTGDGGADHSDCPVLESSFDCYPRPDGDGDNERYPIALVVSRTHTGYGGHHFYYSMRWTSEQDNGTLDDPDACSLNGKIPRPSTTYRNTGTWQPNLAYTGCYEVAAYIPWNSTGSANYRVHDVDGDHDVNGIKQYKDTDHCAAIDDWVALPAGVIYNFNAGTEGWVRLSDETSDPPGLKTCVAFDAMRFQLVQAAEVHVFAFLDLNNDGRRQSEEPLRVGQEVKLYEGDNCSGTLLGQDKTKPDVGYVYDDATKLRFGTIYSAVAVGAKCSQHAVATIDSDCRAEIFVPVCLGSITVCKFSDANMNGVRDPGEEFLSGWPVRLVGRTEDNADVGPIYQVTGDDGCTTFANLEPGTYSVSEESSPTADRRLTWTKFERTCDPGGTYCDWRTNLWPTTQDRHWQFTGALLDSNIVPINTCTTTNPAPTVEGIISNCDSHRVEFGNVCIVPVTVCNFEDENMSGTQDGDETGLQGWPVTLSGTRADGKKLCPEAPTRLTEANGCYVFGESPNPLGLDRLGDLVPPGEYKISEKGNNLIWETRDIVCTDMILYTDWIASWKGKRWLSTRPYPENSCPPLDRHDPESLWPSCCFKVDGKTCIAPSLRFGNVCLGRMFAFKFHDKNMNGRYDPQGEPYIDSDGNGTWTPQEPFTDTPPCNGKQDGVEYYRDTNGNGKWDPAEKWTDTDSDGFYDEAECPIEGWPFRLLGTRADGRQICLGDMCDVKTGPDGIATFVDVPPPNADGYTITEEGKHTVHWYPIDLGGRTAWRTTFGPILPACPSPGCPIERWEATTPLEQTVEKNNYVYCGDTAPESFGNVCLTTVEGTKLVYDDGMPGQSQPRPGVGWEICLAGKDLAGRDVVPSEIRPCQPNSAGAIPCDGRQCDPQYDACEPSGSPPIAIPCKSPVWYSTYCDADGRFRFADLPPGHYELMERPSPDYRLDVDKPLLSGFDLECCPETTLLQNIRKGLAWKVYQAYPGCSADLDQHHLGYSGLFGDAISSVPGILQITPGDNWGNFKQATELCRESPPQNVILKKETPDVFKCSDLFPPKAVQQQGTPNIRLWWPLMYEIPGTEWTLTVQYATKTPVQFPGESFPGYVHQDQWKWTVDADLQDLKNLLELFHELPFGKDEVPLVSREDAYLALQQKLSDIINLLSQEPPNTIEAANLLLDFELEVADLCISTSPIRPWPNSADTGIANTEENPACCKLIIDADYIGQKLGIFHPSR